MRAWLVLLALPAAGAAQLVLHEAWGPRAPALFVLLALCAGRPGGPRLFPWFACGLARDLFVGAHAGVSALLLTTAELLAAPLDRRLGAAGPLGWFAKAALATLMLRLAEVPLSSLAAGRGWQGPDPRGALLATALTALPALVLGVVAGRLRRRDRSAPSPF
jgi:hypothetical protein